MSFKTNRRENSNVHNFLPDLSNTPSTFFKILEALIFPIFLGHLLLTGLQFRGHAMFSEVDRPLGSDTLEYGWLIEIQCGSLFGKVTAAQLYNIFVCMEVIF